MAVKLLVKIAVMTMATAAFRRHRRRRGEGGPSSSSSLTFSLGGKRVSPLAHGLHGVGGARAPLRLDLSLCLSLCFCVLSAALSPFRIYMEIRNSDWIKTFAVIFYQKLAFLRPKKGINRLSGGPRGLGARPPTSCPPRTLVCVDFSSRFSKYSKKYLRPFLSRLDSV